MYVVWNCFWECWWVFLGFFERIGVDDCEL